MHDWSLVEVFLRVATAGSMTAAGGALGMSQSTVSRRIAALEARLGEPLFLRHSRGLALTDRGRRLLDGATGVERSLDGLVSRTAPGLSGVVRVSAFEQVGAVLLAPCWAELAARHPGLAIELTIDESHADLNRGDADLALRVGMRQDADVVATKLGVLRQGLYASAAYLDRAGRPATSDDLRHHRLVGVPRSPQLDRYLAPLGLTGDDAPLRSASFSARREALAAGAGIGGLLREIGASDSRLERVLPDLDLPGLDLWLVVHREQRANPAVQAVREAIRETLRAVLLEPFDPGTMRS
ncbi:MAG: LysR family transcriptional regulator [Alphaproteobacteria bacterium]|nr:LysR family transcriptional regulator [Alphaproteobacteria bacterium]